MDEYHGLVLGDKEVFQLLLISILNLIVVEQSIW